MSNLLNDISRKNAIQKMLIAFAGASLLPISSSAKVQSTFTPNSNGDEKLQPFYVAPTPPLDPGPGGLDIRTLIHSSQTNKQFSCVEFAVAAKKMGPAPHYHKNLDELMYVLDGTVTIMVEDKVYEIPAGGWHFRPRNMVHTFFNNTDKPVRAIDMYFNQNFEDYLEEMFHKILPEMRAKGLKSNDPVVAKQMKDLHDKFGMVGYPEKRQPIVDKYGLW